MEYSHGGDVESYRLEHGTAPLDFSSNGNPLGMPKVAHKAIAAAAKRAHEYPDPHCRELRKAIAKSQGVSYDHILCGNGAADIIYRLALALQPKKALTVAPTFSEYGESLAIAKTEVVAHQLLREEGFRVTERILDDITPDIDVVYLCTPNNPTGLLVEPELMDAIVERCHESDALLVVDECFMGFVEDADRYTLRHRVACDENLLILDAFTKLYGMAGLRLGFCISSNTELLEKIYGVGQPWSVSAIAQAAGTAVLKRTGRYLEKTHELVRTERAWLAKKLRKLGFEVYEGAADYLFFIAERTDLAEQMRERSILIRDCSNYRGLMPGAYRVAVRAHEENTQLVRAFKDVLKG